MQIELADVQDQLQEKYNKTSPKLRPKPAAGQNADVTELLKSKDEYITHLKEELAKAKKDFNDLQKLQDKLEKSGQNQMFEQDVVIKEKNKNIADLQDRLGELEERIRLNQKLLQEKEEQIKQLKAEGKQGSS